MIYSFQMILLIVFFSDNSYEHCFAPMIHCLEVWSILRSNGKWLIRMPYLDKDIYAGNQLDHHHPNMYPEKYHKKLFEICGFEIKRLDALKRKNNDWLLTKNNNINDLHPSIIGALTRRKEITY